MTERKPLRIALDPIAWQEGFDAGRRGAARTDNPYPANDSDKGLAWISGFIEGQAKRRDDTGR